MQRVKSGETTQRAYFHGPSGLTGHTVERARNADSFTSMTTPTVAELGTTGVYSLLLDEDMTITVGKYTEPMVFLVQAAGMSDVVIEVELFTNDVNVETINDATVIGDGNATPWDGA